MYLVTTMIILGVIEENGTLIYLEKGVENGVEKGVENRIENRFSDVGT